MSQKESPFGGMTAEQFKQYQNLPAREREYFLRRHNINLNPKPKRK